MKPLTIGIVGNPNCGKSTLFNALTGSSQKVGNWPGVTVECKTGHFIHQQQTITVIDLPGVYHLSDLSQERSLDERIACDYILSQQADLIVNIIDCAHLERHLYLTTQLLAMQIPLVIAVNMVDVAKRRGIEIDFETLSKQLGCPVVPITANKRKGISQLKQTLITYDHKKWLTKDPIPYPFELRKILSELTDFISRENPAFTSFSQWLAISLLQQDISSQQKLSPKATELADQLRTRIEEECHEEVDILFAGTFYNFAHEVSQAVIISSVQKITLTERIDKIVLNRFLGIPIFLLVMYCMFLFAINLGGAFQDFFDIGSDTLFVQGTTQFLQYLQAPTWLIAILAAGFGKGINTTVSFIPPIGGMFLFLSLLESSGYMARAAVVIDRFMRLVGLPGKSFVPMIVGFGCNVPAILAARTLDNARDRTLTILMSPFMSCGARLAIFAVFTAAFFPSGGQNIVFALYFIGIGMAIITGLLLRKTVLQADLTPLILELPPYHLPSLMSLALHTWQRLKSFIFRAGKLIIPICMLIGSLNAINTDGTLNQQSSNSSSLLASIGRMVTPLFKPMGIEDNNWPATVGLVTGILAKEVVVATLNTLYTQEAHINGMTTPNVSLTQGFKEALMSVPANLKSLKDSFSNPILASAPDHTMNHRVYGVMYQSFGGPINAFAYLLFILLYFPCISATAVMAKELNKKWTLFSVLWSTGVAYGTATLFYQSATWRSHPFQSLYWILTMVTLFLSTVIILRQFSQQKTLALNY